MKKALVIIGAGAAGLAAAAHAAINGVENVVVLEKRHEVGGNANFCWMPVGKPTGPDVLVGEMHNDNLTQEEMNDKAFLDAMDWTHWLANARLVRALIEKASSNYAWLDPWLPDDAKRYVTIDPKYVAEMCVGLGIEIYCNTAAKKLLTNDDGKIAGVLAEKDGDHITIECPAVIIATGGFIGNEGLMKRFLFPVFNDLAENAVVMGIKHTGDGAKMALEIGAATDTTAIEWEVNRFPWKRIGSSALVELMDHYSHPHPIWIDKHGKRFANETLPTSLNSYFRLPGQICYTLFDENMKNIMLYEDSIMPSIADDFNNDWSSHAIEEINTAITSGMGIIANSLDEVAAWIGADARELNQTVIRYNSFCAAKKDYDFLRPAHSLTPIKVPPFYCMKSSVGMLLTHGPIRVNEKMEVINKDDNIISGLYAAGVDIGGMDSETYAGSVPMHSCNWSIASGRIASESACNQIKKK